MTNEHAIKWLKDYLKNGNFSMPQYEEALEMAIQALSQEPCPYSTKDGYCQYDDIAETIPTEQQPCEDAVSRTMPLEKMADYVVTCYADSVEDFEEYSKIRIRCQLPPVTQKSGEWERHYIRPNVYKDLLWYCSSCGKGCGYNNAFMFDFCPNCGARMVEPQESEDKE